MSPGVPVPAAHYPQAAVPWPPSLGEGLSSPSSPMRSVASFARTSPSLLHSHGSLWSNLVCWPPVSLGWHRGSQELLFGLFPPNEVQMRPSEVCLLGQRPLIPSGAPTLQGTEPIADLPPINTWAPFPHFPRFKQPSLPTQETCWGSSFLQRNLPATRMPCKFPSVAHLTSTSWLLQSCSLGLCLSLQLSPLLRS